MKGVKLKNGMGGSNNGKGRTMKTRFLKHYSKKMRRKQDKRFAHS